MLQRFVVGSPLLFCQLLSALVQLPRHQLAVRSRTAHRFQDGREFRHAHRRDHFTESAGTIFTDCTSIRFVGLLFSPLALRVTGVFPILSRTSSPLTTLPKAVYWRSRCG